MSSIFDGDLGREEVATRHSSIARTYLRRFFLRASFSALRFAAIAL